MHRYWLIILTLDNHILFNLCVIMDENIHQFANSKINESSVTTMPSFINF